MIVGFLAAKLFMAGAGGCAVLTIGTSGPPKLSAQQALVDRELFLKRFAKWEPAEVSEDPTISTLLLVDPRLNEQRRAALLSVDELTKCVGADGTVELSSVPPGARQLLSEKLLMTFYAKVVDNSLLSIKPSSDFELTNGTRTLKLWADSDLAPQGVSKHRAEKALQVLSSSERSALPVFPEDEKADFHITSYGFPEDGVRKGAAEAAAVKMAEKLVRRWRAEFDNACEQLRGRLAHIPLEVPKPGQKLDDYKDSAKLKERVTKFYSSYGFASESEAKDFLTQSTFGNVRFTVLAGARTGSLNGAMVLNYFSLRPQFLK